MKKLIAKIRAILRNRRVRKIWTRTVSSTACLVVFVTTYALILPAITMESEASCGIEAHQHDESCYEERLLCNIPESDGHAHTDDCYTTIQKLICDRSEHLHTSDCYDEEGNLICSQEEHQHGKECYVETRELICGLEESEGHHHDSSCYEKVLTCKKEVHTHSTACYREDAASVAATEHAAVAATTTTSADDDAIGEAANASGTFDPTETAAEGYVPPLDELDFRQLLNDHTAIYYHKPADSTEDSGQSTDWQKVDEDTVLGESDILRVYLAYTIPAGSLNETNETARYRLPGNLHLTDEQMEAINQMENGLSGLYVDYDTLQITDTEKHSAYLGAEAVDGLRTPDQTIEDYLSDNNDTGDGEQTAQEIISAVVKANQVYDEDGVYGKKGAYLGTDLVFTFSPYTILKNRNEYDSEGTPVKAGESVSGWFTLDFNMDQIDWGGNAAEITFVSEDNDLNTGLVSVALKKADPTSEETPQETNPSSEESPDSNNSDDEKTFNENSSTEENKAETVEETHPAVSFEDSLTVHTGNLSSDTDAGSLPNSSKMTVSVSAEAGTFPAGTTMVLSAVTDMDAVAEAVEGAVDDRKTMGFHAVDISFRDVNGNEIEPLKPIKVSMTSDAIQRAVEDESTAPVVVHVEDGDSYTSHTAETENSNPAPYESPEGSTAAEIADPAEKEKADAPTATVIEANTEGSDASHGSTDNTLTFEAASFSVYAIVYTVDFHWGEYTFSIPGGEKINLSDMIEQLGLLTGTGYADADDFLANVENVTFSDETLVKVHKNLLGKDWTLESLAPFTTNETLTITMKNGDVVTVKVTDAQSTMTVSIKFFAKDAEIIKENQDPSFPQPHISGNQEPPNDPALQSHYYLLAILKDAQGNELGWAINPVTLNNATTQTSFSQFNMFESQGENETPEDYAERRGQDTNQKINYDKDINNISLRLYRADNQLSTVNYHELVTEHATNHTYDSPEDGYEFGGSFVKGNKTEAEIHLKKANNKKYKVRIYLDQDAVDDILSSDNYYLYLKINHASGEPSYQYVKLDIKAETYKGQYVEYEFPHWMDQNGNLKPSTMTNNTFTGNERGIEVKLLKFDGDFKPNNYTNATVNEEGSAIKAYMVHYDTALTAPKETTTHYTEETHVEDGKTVIYCIDNVELKTIDAEGQYNYASILGPNLNYGIVADHLYHENHMQTNFAVNHYTGHGHDARPDLSGSSGGQIVIAEYNKIVSDFWVNGPVNGVGEPVSTVDIAGQLKIGDPLSGTLVVYADDNSGSPGDLGSENAKVKGNLDQTVVIQTDGAELSENIVEPALHHMDRMSAELASQPATFVPPIPNNGKLTIDTKSFPDDATIFIDADRIKSFIGSAGQLIIDKKPDQTIIFNFKETHNKTEEITLAQFVVKQEGFPEGGYTTSTPVGTGAKENEYMDAIARHVVWNLYGVQGKTIIDISAGIYLQPNEDSVIDVKGTTAGWIVSEGLVSNGSGEWHNVYAEMPDTSSVKLDAYKTVDGKQPRASQKFNFFLNEYDTSVSGNWKPIYSNIQNSTGSISFPEIKNLSPGWHVYRITEDQVKPEGTNGYFIMDDAVYYAVVNVISTTTAGDAPATIVTPPVYYRNFDPMSFDPTSNTLTGFSNTDKVNAHGVTFDNEEVKEGMNILKKVQGTTAKDVDFTFKVELWYVENDADQPYVAAGAESATFSMITPAGNDTFTLDPNNNENGHSIGYVTLKAGELVSIQGIESSAHYRITEVKVGDKDITNSNEPVDGYSCLTAVQTGDMDQGLARAVFENEYMATGALNLKAHKTLTDKTNTGKQLGENMFAFRLAGHNAVDPENWIWNDASGNVTFPTISYSSADMADAVPDPNNDNKLTKTLTYTIHENHQLGTGATGFAAQNMTYDDDRTVTVTLVDDGKGNISATPSIDGNPIDNLTVAFNNTYEYKASKGFDGTKVLTGRDMEDQEFWFNAVLTKYNDGTTETTYPDDDALAAVDFISATKIEGTNTADGRIVFPVITFRKAGTYTFTVTEDVDRLPFDVEPTTENQSYDVTIVVSEGIDTATNEKILIAAEPAYPNGKTICNTANNEEKTEITVNKQWFRGDEKITGSKTGSVTFDLYRTTEEISGSGTGSMGGSSGATGSGTKTVTLRSNVSNPMDKLSPQTINCNEGDILVVTLKSRETGQNDGTKYIFNGQILSDGNQSYSFGDYWSDTDTRTIEIPVNDTLQYLEFSQYSRAEATVTKKNDNSGSGSQTETSIFTRTELEALTASSSYMVEKVNREPITISAPDWTYTSGETLPKYVSGTETEWHYFVVEHTPNGYVDTYEINGDTLTIKNTLTNEKTGFSFSKVWPGSSVDLSDTTAYQDWQKEITVTIMRKVNGTDDSSFKLVYQLNSGDGPFSPVSSGADVSVLPQAEGELTSLQLTKINTNKVFTFALPVESLASTNSNGDSYTYYVTEANLDDYVIKYGTITDQDSTSVASITPGATCAKDGEAIVNQTFGGYELPSTGGPGTRLFTILGSILILGAGVLLWRRRRLI